MKFDLHVHSCRSVDSRASFEDIYAAARARGLSGLAICDHNVFAPPPPCPDLILIPGCEYSTTAGHMLTLFLQKPLEKQLSRDSRGLFAWRDVVDAAHAQGALVFLAHPYAPKVSRTREVWQAVDGIEVFNARIEHSRVQGANLDAQSTCLLMKKPFSAGSDAHFPGEVGRTYWECDAEPTLAGVKAALLSGSGRVFAGTASPFYRPMSQWIKMKDTKNYRAVPKIAVRFLLACLRTFRRHQAGYLNMKGAKTR